MEGVLDEIVIEDLLSFDTFTTIKQHEQTISIQFLFVVKNIQEIQIIGSLFEKGQQLRITSALLTRKGLDPGLITIKAIKSIKGSLYWDCLTSSVTPLQRHS